MDNFTQGVSCYTSNMLRKIRCQRIMYELPWKLEEANCRRYLVSLWSLSSQLNYSLSHPNPRQQYLQKKNVSLVFFNSVYINRTSIFFNLTIKATAYYNYPRSKPLQESTKMQRWSKSQCKVCTETNEQPVQFLAYKSNELMEISTQLYHGSSLNSNFCFMKIRYPPTETETTNWKAPRWEMTKATKCYLPGTEWRRWHMIVWHQPFVCALTTETTELET